MTNKRNRPQTPEPDPQQRDGTRAGARTEDFSLKDICPIKKDAAPLTPEEIDQLKSYIREMQKLERQEPKWVMSTLSTEEKEAIFKYLICGEGKEPEKAKCFTVIETKNPKTGNMEKSFYDTAWEAWNRKTIKVNKKYNELIRKIILLYSKERKEGNVFELIKEAIQMTQLSQKPQEPAFFQCLQGTAINSLTTAKTSGLIPDIAGTAFVNVGDNFRLKIVDYPELKGGYLSPSTLQVFWCFVRAFTASPNKTTKVKLPLRTFMEWRGLSDEKSARRQVIDAIRDLKHFEISIKEKVNGKWENSGYIGIYGGTGYIRNGVIHFNFNQDFYENLMRCTPMDCMSSNLKLNTKQYPHAIYFGDWIDLNYRMNAGKKRLPTISVKTLMEKAPQLPTYEEVTASDRHYYRRIIKPVIENLDAIDQLVYEFISPDGETIENPLEAFKGPGGYTYFELCKISVDYSDYPKHEERIQAKEKRKAAYEKAKIKAAATLAAKAEAQKNA